MILIIINADSYRSSILTVDPFYFCLFYFFIVVLLYLCLYSICALGSIKLFNICYTLILLFPPYRQYTREKASFSFDKKQSKFGHTKMY